ncbi:MAG: DUF167 domain-containing protein [Actinomycetota bacterium]|nr:DUF167 domain-containing protein [Actinomycetota bacterium]
MTELVRPHAEGAVLSVRAVPGASAAKLVGQHGGELRVRVCSPPVDGRANEEIVKVVAAALGLRPRAVRLLAGHTARSKQLLVALPPDELLAHLAPWISPDSVAGR